jgi:hypothetical protein
MLKQYLYNIIGSRLWTRLSTPVEVEQAEEVEKLAGHLPLPRRTSQTTFEMSLLSHHTGCAKARRDSPSNLLCGQCKDDFPIGEAWVWTERCLEDIEKGTIVRISSTRRLIDSAKDGCHLCSVILGAFCETFFAGADGKNFGFNEGIYQLQALLDISGWTLGLFPDCPVLQILSEMSFPSNDLRLDLLLLLPHDRPKEFSTGRGIWTLDTTRSGTLSQIDSSSVQIDSTCNLDPSAVLQIKTWMDSLYHPGLARLGNSVTIYA